MRGKLIVDIARDSMSASACILENGNTEITEEMVKEELEAYGIVEGINETAICDMVHLDKYRKMFTVAKGRQAARGKDGWYQFLFDKDLRHIKSEIQDDGRVAYDQNLQLVEKGDKIAIYHAPVQGRTGITIFGSQISSIPVKEARPMELVNVEEKKGSFYAKEHGRVELCGNKLIVVEQFTIDGDIEITEKAMDYSGDVYVKGNIKDDVVMHVGGNLIVEGSVAGADLTVLGDMIVCGEIHGKEKAKIKVEGSLTVNFIEGADIDVNGDVLAGYMVNDKVVSHSNVNVTGKDGIILGGQIVADESIHAKWVGSESGDKTCLKIESPDAWSKSYAKIVIENKAYTGTSLEINGGMFDDSEVSKGELHLNQQGVVEKYEIDTYQYENLEKMLSDQIEESAVAEKKRILVVDDDPVFLKMQYIYLSEDYEVSAVSTAEDALRFLNQSIPDLILLDYLMPGMNGSDLLKHIRALPEKSADIPVFFLTSVTDKNVMEQCLSLFPQKYLIKPMEKQELLQIISDFFTNEQKADGAEGA